MQNIIFETHCGDDFTRTSQKALKLAIESKQNGRNQKVEFDFNGVRCIVSTKTNLDWLFRDYKNSHIMEWKQVGDICVAEYSPNQQKELERREKEREERYAIDKEERKKKELEEKKVFTQKVNGIQIELKDKEGWDKIVEVNKDPYGACAVFYAEGWAKLMQIEMSKGRTIIECASETSHELNFLGITGFMYGCAVNILSKCWKHGEELRKWHNRDYGHEGDGVVNPAVMTIGLKK